MDLKLYDTLAREKRVFTPLDPGNVRMYVCGPTVYDFAHIGNARPVIVFDVLFRLLRHLYGPEHVTYVRNITDVDDKINARAAERLAKRGEASGDLNAEIRRLTEETYANFKADVAALGCLPPTVEPRATEHIEEMKALIERLVASGHAYVAEDHVLFAVGSMPDYGRLSKRPLDEMIAGARVEVAPYKRDAMDFVLWKPSKPGEPAWPSPCGIGAPGRPGWHIECSAMSDYWLWTKAEPRLSAAGLAHPHQFDIHGGGVDLVFPHHENEIAQSRCGFHTPVMANYWMHNGFLMVEGEKMAKSLGNFITIRELLKDWPGEVVRLNMLKTHYRQPIDWTGKSLEESEKEIDSFLNVAADFAGTAVDADFLRALSDDLNVPAAIAVLHTLRTAAAAAGDIDAGGRLRASLSLLGFFETELDRGGLVIFPPDDAIRDPVVEELFPQRTKIDVLKEMLELAPKNYPLKALTRSLSNTNWNFDFSKQLKAFHEAIQFVSPEIRIGDLQKYSDRIDQISSLVLARAAARVRKDFKEADRIRDELLAMGVVLKDTKDGTTWEVAR
ncbi:MAG: cysteine--tRNA ligase [Xanthobacteraceae bacterium]